MYHTRGEYTLPPPNKYLIFNLLKKYVEVRHKWFNNDATVIHVAKPILLRYIEHSIYRTLGFRRCWTDTLQSVSLAPNSKRTI